MNKTPSLPSLLLAGLLGLASAESAGLAALVAVDIEPGGGLHRSGLRDGDRVIAWSMDGARPTPLASHVAFHTLATQGLQREVLLLVEAGPDATPRELRVPAGHWRGRVEDPELTALLESELEDAALREKEESFVVEGRRPAAARLAVHLAQRSADKVDPSILTDVLGAEATPELAWAFETLGHQHAEDDLEAGLRILERARDTWIELDESTAAARVMVRAGRIDLGRGRLPEAEEALEAAIALARSSESPAIVAEGQAQLGIAHWFRGDIEGARDLFENALDLRSRHAPGSLEHAESLSHLGNAVGFLGDHPEAMRLQRDSLSLREVLAPGSRYVAGSLNNLAALALERGLLAEAEELLRRAITLNEAQNPDSRSLAIGLQNLGNVLLGRGDLDAAEREYRRCLEMQMKLGEESHDTAHVLQNLAGVRLAQGHALEAEELARRAVLLKRALGGADAMTAWALIELATIQIAGDRWNEAAQNLDDALQMTRTSAPASMVLADALLARAEVDLHEGDAAKGLARAEEALATRLVMAPASRYEAQARWIVAQALVALGHLDEARSMLEQAVETLEDQARRLGGSTEEQGEFRALHQGVYRLWIDLLARDGRAEEAFHVLERSRAAGTLLLMAERDLELADESHPEGAELERRRRLLARQVSRLVEALQDAESDAERAKLVQDLASKRQEEEALFATFRERSPRLAALRDPRGGRAEVIGAALPATTALVTWTLGDERGWIFALGRDSGLVIEPLPASREHVAKLVAAFRSQIIDRRAPPDHPAMAQLGRELERLLLGPVRAHLPKQVEHLLLVPEGPLLELPFAALPFDGSGSLIERFALSFAISGTVATQEISVPPMLPSPERRRLVTFADPELGAEGLAGTRGFDLAPLPSARREALGLAALWGEDARTFLGAEANEATVVREGQTAHILHFATHAVVDDRRPLDSALVLSPGGHGSPEAQDGWLRAWEVFERLDLTADLVTLAACETARGREREGEGTLGLVRAFLHAGARAVLASQWRIADTSSAALMLRFYRGLSAGHPPHAALREAQLALLRGEEGPGHRAPFHWAAFQVHGRPSRR